MMHAETQPDAARRHKHGRCKTGQARRGGPRGRTAALIKGLGEGRVALVVHHPAVRTRIRDLVQAANAADGRARKVEVYPVRSPVDARVLETVGCPIVVDHGFWDRGVAPETQALVREIIREADEARATPEA